MPENTTEDNTMDGEPTQFDRFADIARKVFAAPKAEVEKRIEAEKKRRVKARIKRKAKPA